MRQGAEEVVKYWSNDDLGGVECLYAEYLTFSFAPHFHEGFAVGVIESGADVFDYRGSRRIAAAGEIMLINPLEVHDGHAFDASGWTFRIMYIPPELLKRVREEISGATSDVPFFSQTVVRDGETAKAILRLHQALENSASRLERESLFWLAMTRLVERHADSKTVLQKTGRERSAVARVREYLRANLCQNITLRQLANVAFLSPFHLLRVFQKEMGFTPHAYQTQLRIDYAKRLLREDSSISHAALAAGFFDQAHFSKQFKRYVGISPGGFLAGG